jgi:hypothetical protein
MARQPPIKPAVPDLARRAQLAALPKLPDTRRVWKGNHYEYRPLTPAEYLNLHTPKR